MTQMFSTSANHFAYMALLSYPSDIAIDLIKRSISPKQYRKPRNQTLVDHCSQRFEEILRDLYPAPVSDAFLNVTFNLSSANAEVLERGLEGRFICKIFLPDGRFYRSELIDRVIPQD